jgi:hypothetical protein
MNQGIYIYIVTFCPTYIHVKQKYKLWIFVRQGKKYRLWLFVLWLFVLWVLWLFVLWLSVRFPWHVYYVCQILIIVSTLSPNASVCLLSFGEKVTCQPNDNYDCFVRIRVMVFNATFNNILFYRGGQFYWWRKLEYPEKTSTCRKSLINFFGGFVLLYKFKPLFVVSYRHNSLWTCKVISIPLNRWCSLFNVNMVNLKTLTRELLTKN